MNENTMAIVGKICQTVQFPKFFSRTHVQPYFVIGNRYAPSQPLIEI